MTSVIESALAAELATLTREVEPSTEPLGFGIDLDCVTDVTEDFAETDPRSPKGIAQGAIRCLTTPRGSLVDDPDYGFDLRAVTSRGVATGELRGIASAIAGEVTKDDRISDVTVELSASLANQTLDVKLRIQPKDPALGTFSLTFVVTSAEVLINTISLTAGA